MNYIKQNFVDGQVLEAEHLNHMEQGIASIAAIASNPNLLDNWYFADPINQRGQTEYTAAGYAIDRWKLGGSAANLTIDDGVILSATTKWGANIIQICSPEMASALAGKETTLSVLLEESTGQFLIEVYANGAWFSTLELADGLSQKHFTLPSDLTTLQFKIMHNSDGEASIKLKAIKLELGSQQTLARQENGVWVLNDPPPNKQQELAKCQRYFQRFIANLIVVAPSVWFAQGVIVLPVTMRTNPTIVFGDIYIDSNWISDNEEYDSATIYSIYENSIVLRLPSSSGKLTTGKAYMIELMVSASADL